MMTDDQFDQSAEAAARAFELAGARIEQALSQAAKTGELSFSDMVENILQDLAKIAVQELVSDPLSGLFSSLLGTGGAAQGGAGQTVNISMNVAGGQSSNGLRQSLGQISSSLGRAVLDSQRFL